MARRRGAGGLSACALFTALLAVCSQLQIPLPGVPVNMALFAVHLGGMLLGPSRSLAAVLAYLILGAFGAPVFSGFASGPAAFFGPTGGFLLGYLLCAPAVGALAQHFGRTTARLCAAGLAGTALCTLCGAAWFMMITKAQPSPAFLAYWLIFLPGDMIKIVLAALLAGRLQKPLKAMGM